MITELKKTNFKYLKFILLTLISGLLISFYNLSVLFLLASIFFILISFKYFNQILLLLILYIPFQVALNITHGIDLASGRVFILYLFAVWIIKSLAEKRFIIRLNLQTLLISAFLFFAIFSILQAWDIERALRKILVFLSIFPLYFIITSLKINKKRVYKIINILFISGFILSLIGILQFVLRFFVGIDPIIIFWSKYVSPVFYGETFGAQVVSNPSWLVNISGATVLRAFSLFPDPHMFSFYLGLLIPIALAIALCGKNNDFTVITRSSNDEVIPKLRAQIIILYLMKLKTRLLCRFASCNGRIFLYFILITMLLAEFLTFSRGGYIGMIAGIGITIILLWRYIGFNKKIILGVTTGILVLFLLFTNQSIINRFLSSFDFNEGSNIERIKNWNQGAEMFSDNFLFGVGIGNYSSYLYPTVNYRTPIYAHNLYLDIGAEMGIFALIIWVGLILITIYQLLRINKNTEDEFLRAVSAGLIGSFLWFSVHSFFDTPIYSPTILAIFMVIISISVMIIKVDRE